MQKRTIFAVGALALSALLGSNAQAQVVSGLIPVTGPLAVTINTTGRVAIQGVNVTANVESVVPGTIIVGSWGGNWTINISASTTLVNNSQKSKISMGEIEPRDRLVITGIAVSTEDRIINATKIRNLSMERHRFRGVVNTIDVAGRTFTLFPNSGPIVTVRITNTSRVIIDEQNSALENLTPGMRVRVVGDLNAARTVITAVTVRSLPNPIIIPAASTTTTTPSSPTTTSPTTTPVVQTPTSTPVATTTVNITNSSFNPFTITIPFNGTATWVNNDSLNHTIRFDDNSFDSGVIGPSGTFSYTFARSGTYNYHCGIHPEMKGTIIVR